MSQAQIQIDAAKKHIVMALNEFHPLPVNQDELIEKLRDYFADQKVEVFGKVIFKVGEEGFKDIIAEAVIESGKYFRDEDGQIKVKA